MGVAGFARIRVTPRFTEFWRIRLPQDQALTRHSLNKCNVNCGGPTFAGPLARSRRLIKIASGHPYASTVGSSRVSSR